MDGVTSVILSTILVGLNILMLYSNNSPSGACGFILLLRNHHSQNPPHSQKKSGHTARFYSKFMKASAYFQEICDAA